VLRLSAQGLTVCLAILLAGPGAAHAARNEAEAAAQLARVQARIRAATEAVQDAVSKRDSAAAALRTADLAYAAARRRVEDVRARRAASEQRRNELRHERERAGRELESERAALAGQLRSAYLGGPQEQLRVLLNADDPATLGRMLAYYSYLGRARSQRIAAIGAQASRLEAVDEALSMEDARLAALEEERRHEALAQDAARASRERALHDLEARVASHKEELKDLRANAASLEDLLARLRAALADFDDPDLAGPGGKRRPFAQVRGRLPWPARGTLIASFGEPRPGGLRWNGVLLETREGATSAPRTSAGSSIPTGYPASGSWSSWTMVGDISAYTATMTACSRRSWRQSSTRRGAGHQPPGRPAPGRSCTRRSEGARPPARVVGQP
jgi:septal ring factor EnvC (AmiA/AmiB activator)